MVPEVEVHVISLNAITRAMARAVELDGEMVEPELIPEFKPAPAHDQQQAHVEVPAQDTPRSELVTPQTREVDTEKQLVDLKQDLMAAYRVRWLDSGTRQVQWRVPKDGSYWYRGHKVVIPSCQEAKSLREKLIREHHDLPIAGHMGFKRTKASVERKLDWRRLPSEVQRYVATCDSCCKHKSERQRPIGLLRAITGATPAMGDSHYGLCHQLTQDGGW
jgi:hypothetical protein